MGIRINQRCDGCGKIRRLHDVKDRNDNWVQVRDNKDLCNVCISEALIKHKSQEKEAEATVVITCENHKPTQHRDGKEPWCEGCGLTKDFLKPYSMFDSKKEPNGK